MKKSEIGDQYNIEQMADNIGQGCSEIFIKESLTFVEPQFQDIPLVSTSERGRGLFHHAQPYERKAEIAQKWLSVCTSLRELHSAYHDMRHTLPHSTFHDFHLPFYYTTRIEELVNEEIKRDHTFESLFVVLAEFETNGMHEANSGAAKLMFEAVCELAEKGKVQDPSDIIVTYQKFTVISKQGYILVSKLLPHITPSQAMKILQRLKQVTPLCCTPYSFHRLLVCKAAEGYRR